MLSQESAEKEQEPRPPAEASKMPAAPGSADAGLDSVLADAADPDVPAVELCAVSIDVPDSVETVVVNTSNGTPGVSLSDTTLPDAVVSAVLKSDSAAGTLDDASGLPDAAAAAALSSVVDSEPAAVETVVSTEALPDVTVPSTSGLSSVSTSSSVSDRCDARIVRFNNRDLESLRKIQNELNTRKSGGVPRSPGSPIVIRAELTSPQKGVSAQAPQVLVVQKPSPGCSPKKADIRVIHPPGLTVRRQLQMSVPAVSGGGTTSGGLTKVILQPAGQLMSGATFQFVGAMAGAGGQAAQPTLVLSSPTRATPIRTTTGQQLVRVAAPGTTSVSAPKGMYVVSPMKVGGKVAMIPINVGKSPQRIAPAPTTSSVVTGLSVATSRVALAASSTSTATTPTVRPTVPTTTIVPVPGKVNVLLKPSIGQAVAVSRAGTVTAVVQTSSASGAVATSGTSSLVTSVSSSSAAVQVPGSKFHYVRLVSAPAASTQASTVLGAAKPPTLVPVTSARPLVPAVPATVASSTSSATLPAGVRLTVPIAPAISAQQGSSTGATVSNSQRVLIPASATSVRPSLPTGPLSSLPTAALISAGGTSMQNAFVVVPAQYVAQELVYWPLPEQRSKVQEHPCTACSSSRARSRQRPLQQAHHGWCFRRELASWAAPEALYPLQQPPHLPQPVSQRGPTTENHQQQQCLLLKLKSTGRHAKIIHGPESPATVPSPSVSNCIVTVLPMENFVIAATAITVSITWSMKRNVRRLLEPV
ncbi:uncharacterized protein [Dermacentor andersoni]|uniref:uncharacterized protein isoform X5 n=1 Tax=Dermacentor andersoni TaxID=34620 RepID=UPI002155BBD5|nr:mucin-5AC-like isoform X5 [Dermacentor andersoni]